MDKVAKEFVDEHIKDILPLLRKINKDSVEEYCNRRIQFLYSYKDTTFRGIQYSLLDGYDEHRFKYIRRAINSAMETHDPESTQLLEFVINCIISVLNSNKSLYSCILKSISGDAEEFLDTANELYKEIIEYIYKEYESSISINEYDEIYSFLDKYDAEHENRWPAE